MPILGPIGEITSSKTASRRTPAATKAVFGEQVLDSYFGHLWYGQFSLCTVGAAENVGQGNAVAAGRVQGGWERRSFQVRFHGSQSRCRVVHERKIPKTGKLVAGIRAQTRGMSRSCDRRVIRCGRQGIMGESRRRRRRRVGRVRPRSLGMTHGTTVVVILIVI